ncbi:MAG TPA: amidohydrolase family protein [Acidimicrobiales bacterium]|nr:amidohydrolase family protein [Acidimicrobiales bacterium]
MATPLVDTHTHVASADRDSYPLHRPASPLGSDWVEDHPLDAEQLVAALDDAGVHAAIMVQPVGTYGFDNSYLADATAVAPGRLAGASVIDMSAADPVDALTYWSAERAIGGTRLFNVPPADPPWLATDASAAVLRRAGELGVRVSACVLPPDLPRLGGLLDQAGEVPIALDHCGFADISNPESDTMADLVALGKHANLRLKVTTTILRMHPPATGDERDVVERLAAIFGVERLMWGSDYPQHYRETYRQHVELARWLCSRLSAGDQARLLGGTALELWPELAQ